jgi:hypothetical protein
MALTPNNPQAPEIVYTPEFKRNLRQLAKKYLHIKSDVQPIIEDLGSGTGSPNSRAVSIHSSMASFMFLSANSSFSPWDS